MYLFYIHILHFVSVNTTFICFLYRIVIQREPLSSIFQTAFCKDQIRSYLSHLFLIYPQVHLPENV